MDVDAFLKSVESWGLAENFRQSLYLFPLLESIHVIGLSLVVGTITVIDLRLLGIASANRPFQRMASDILKWTWVAFAITLVTGVLMFTTNARVYYHNIYFELKMALLVAAGLNMFLFEMTARRSVREWDQKPSAPASGKTVAVLSLAFWIAIIFMGRIIGFTTTHAVAAPPPTNVNFDDFLGGGAPSNPAPAPPATKK
jgi:hypothetical protein